MEQRCAGQWYGSSGGSAPRRRVLRWSRAAFALEQGSLEHYSRGSGVAPPRRHPANVTYSRHLIEMTTRNRVLSLICLISPDLVHNTQCEPRVALGSYACRGVKITACLFHG